MMRKFDFHTKELFSWFSLSWFSLSWFSLSWFSLSWFSLSWLPGFPAFQFAAVFVVTVVSSPPTDPGATRIVG
jgi:hypothetical protein